VVGRFSLSYPAKVSSVISYKSGVTLKLLVMGGCCW